MVIWNQNTRKPQTRPRRHMSFVNDSYHLVRGLSNIPSKSTGKTNIDLVYINTWFVGRPTDICTGLQLGKACYPSSRWGIWEMFYYFCFFTFINCPLSPLSLSRNMKNIKVFYLKIFSFWRWNFLCILMGAQHESRTTLFIHTCELA